MNVKFVFSPRYDFSMMGLERLHPFDAHKYGRAWALLKRKLDGDLERYWLDPKEPASDELLLRVHTKEYLASLRSSATVARALELWPARFVPNSLLQSGALTPMKFAVQGTVLATEVALRTGAMVMNFGGGFHHAFRDHGEGFCIYADMALAIADQRAAGRLRSEDQIMVIDLDAHRGNGFEDIVELDGAVHVFDVYNSQIYPGLLPHWDPDAKPFIIPVLPMTNDQDYRNILTTDLPKFFEHVGSAKLAFYNAGTDIVSGDPIGRLDVSPEAVTARDRLVIDMLASRRIPTVILPSGGYTKISHKLIAEMALYLVRKGDSVDGSDVRKLPEGAQGTGRGDNAGHGQPP
jgi:histone deacetylase 11